MSLGCCPAEEVPSWPSDLFQVFQVEKEGLQTHHVSQANIPTAVLFPPFSCNCDSQKR